MGRKKSPSAYVSVERHGVTMETKQLAKDTPAELQFYKDKKGDWRWRTVAPENGKRLAAATEGYRNRDEMILAMRRTGLAIQRYIAQLRRI